jgi:hypothetical protein
MYPTLVMGIVTLLAALRSAFRVDGRLQGFLNYMNGAVLFSALTGFVTGLISTGQYIESHQLQGGQAVLTALQGAKESTNNLSLGFLLISLSLLVMAVARRRLDARGAE